jgi:hypothetical protein
MSYIRAHKVDIEEGQVSRDGAVHLELPDYGEAGDQIDQHNNLDDELLPFVLELIANVDALADGEALVVWKVIF